MEEATFVLKFKQADKEHWLRFIDRAIRDGGLNAAQFGLSLAIAIDQAPQEPVVHVDTAEAAKTEPPAA